MNILYEFKVMSITFFGSDLMNYNIEKPSHASL